MVMHTIAVTYDPTTRHMSLAEGSDLYGGATLDSNSVTISVTGVPAEYSARLDFGVFVEQNGRLVHPHGDLVEGSYIVDNSILEAASEKGKLPFQLVIVKDSIVVNSRNTIILTITRSIDASIDGSELPVYTLAEWRGLTRANAGPDTYLISVTYDPVKRNLSLDDRELYGGATIDTNSVMIAVSGIVPDGIDFKARLDFAVLIKDGKDATKPFVLLENVDGLWCAMVPQPVLMAARELKKLPFQLVTRHGDTVINSRNTIVLEVTRAIDALDSISQEYVPYIMFRNDTWEWVADFTYALGSVVTKDGELYISLVNDNLGHAPDGPDGPEYWRKKAEGLPDGQHDWQILGRDDDSAEWHTLSEKHEVTTAANTVQTVEHQFGNRPVTCTFYEGGQKVEVPYSWGEGTVSFETTAAHTLTLIITALPYEAIA